jgi:adenosine 3'-phospho 5'-phosphosulfate transporter B3
MDKNLSLFGFDISSFPRWLILLICVVGIFASFILQGTAHEKIFNKYQLKESLFLTFLQFFGYASLSFRFFIDLIRGKTKLHPPFWFYLITSMALVGSMALSNYSLQRLSYPTQVLFRSSKLIPVMLGSFFFLKKKYSMLEILSVFLIVAGLIGMSVSDKKVHNKFDTVGLIAVIASLFCDAFASNLEEKAFTTYQAPQNEVIAMIYLIGSLIVGAVSIPTGQFVNGCIRIKEEPGLIIQIIFFTYLGAVGIQFVYVLIKGFGSVVTVMVTSLRKAFTVTLSFVLFSSDKKFTSAHFFSILSIASGIGLNVYGKNKNKGKKPNPEDKSKESYASPTETPIDNDIGAVGDPESLSLSYSES